MRRHFTFAAVLAAGALAVGATSARSARADEAEIRATLNRYFSGKADVMATAFAPGANMTYVRDSMIITPIPQFIERIREGERRAAGSKESSQTRPEPEKQITSVDIAGNAAIARLDTKRPDMLVVDYMTLLKVNGQWLIVNKSFDRLPIKQ